MSRGSLAVFSASILIAIAPGLFVRWRFAGVINVSATRWSRYLLASASMFANQEWLTTAGPLLAGFSQRQQGNW